MRRREDISNYKNVGKVNMNYMQLYIILSTILRWLRWLRDDILPTHLRELAENFWLFRVGHKILIRNIPIYHAIRNPNSSIAGVLKIELLRLLLNAWSILHEKSTVPVVLNAVVLHDELKLFGQRSFLREVCPDISFEILVL